MTGIPRGVCDAAPRPLFVLREGLHLVLASASPRRRHLLASWGLPFQCREATNAEPTPEEHESPEAFARRAAVAKSQAVAHALVQENPAAQRSTIILAADTVVSIHGDILGKPCDAREALAMLERLNGEVHRVITAVSLHIPLSCSKAYKHLPSTERQRRPQDVENTSLGEPWHEETFYEKSEVAFHTWLRHVLEAYVRTGEPLDKAGAYAIQGQGAFLVSRVSGDWTNVVGLPLPALARLLLDADLIEPARDD